VQGVDHASDAQTEIFGYRPEDFSCMVVVFLTLAEKFRESNLFIIGCFSIHTEGGRIGGVNFPAASVPAPTRKTLRFNRHMPKFTRIAEMAGEQFVVDD